MAGAYCAIGAIQAPTRTIPLSQLRKMFGSEIPAEITHTRKGARQADVLRYLHELWGQAMRDCLAGPGDVPVEGER